MSNHHYLNDGPVLTTLEGSQRPPNSSAKIQSNSLLEKILSYFIYEQVGRNDAFIIQAALLQIKN